MAEADLSPLPDDLIPDILVRLEPDDPAGVVRAAAVCKAWRRILADPAFAARYRALHPTTAPVLGFLHNQLHVSRFVPTSPFRPRPAADHWHRRARDCRHGRVLFYEYYRHRVSTGEFVDVVVWDPVTGGECFIIPNVAMDPRPRTNTAAAGCDHRACAGGGPYIVALAAVKHTGNGNSEFHTSFYSSDTGRWSSDLFIHLGRRNARWDLVRDRPAALVGDSLYFVAESGALLGYRYGLLRRLGDRGFLTDYNVLSVIEPPKGKRLDTVFAMAAEDGGLGLASLNKDSSWLYLWAREAGQDDDRRRARLSGVAEDGSAIFVSTEDGVFTVGLAGSSSQAWKVSEVGNVDVLYPFMSFYTESLLVRPSLACLCLLIMVLIYRCIESDN
ncbi:unnamed protein product [Urochloa decumbens]|uniref:F-box domain-containing protein n=1 Tax=Urochloa decumbens TaxID=240449 RepID=A0ABC9F3S6_9POAL